MKNSPALLDLPAEEALFRMITARQEAVVAALEHMKDRRDPEALHEFRVALRRLRSLLRAYRRPLRGVAGRKIRRALKKLASATNAGRDAEVQLAWLEEQRPTLARGERCGLNWLVRRNRKARRDGQAQLRRHGRQDFRKISERLSEKMAARAEAHPPAGPPLRKVLEPLLRVYLAELESHFEELGRRCDPASVHAARIAVKRLRYLLEPFRPECPAAHDLVRATKTLQNALGDLHDMQVLDDQLARDLDQVATEKAHLLRDLALQGDQQELARTRRLDERLGLATLSARVQARRDELVAELKGRCLEEVAPALLRDARAFLKSLTPPEIPVERERKYLLRALPPATADAAVVRIDQGWLPGKTLRERIRRVTDDNGERYYRTVKLGHGVERIEIEDETTAEIFEAMWPLTEGCRIRKRRYRIPEGDLVWEIDEFLDRDLVLAEVELDAVDQAVPLPDWIGGVMDREVTDDPAYVNLNLATSAVGH